jgi:hypothetical protein
MTARQSEVIRLTQEQMGQAQEEIMGTRAKFWFDHPQLGRCLFKYIRPGTGEDWSDSKTLNTLDLFKHIVNPYQIASQEWLSRLEAISEQQITLILQALPADRFSEVASDFVKKILLTNKERLLSL